MAPLSRTGSSCSPTWTEWGCSEAQEQQHKAYLAAPGQGRGGLTLRVKAIAKGIELSSVQYICLRDQGEQLALREDGGPTQVRSGPNLFPLVKSATSTKMTGRVLSLMILK